MDNISDTERPRSQAVNARERAASRPRSYTDAARLFDYPAGLPLSVEVLQSRQQEDITVEDIVFPSPSGENVSASLVKPRQGGRGLAAVLFVHWLGHHHCNRGEFLADALLLAGKGVVSLDGVQ